MIRKKKKYAKPRQIYEKERIEEENVLKTKYGLKNKREIWKTLAKVTYFRHRAKELAKMPREEQQVFFNKLNALGLKVNTLAEVLDLKIEDLLNRRLPTVVVSKSLAPTVNTARQMVVHKKILIGGRVVNSPSYLVPVAEENSIIIKKKKISSKKKEESEASEIKENNLEEGEEIMNNEMEATG